MEIQRFSSRRGSLIHQIESKKLICTYKSYMQLTRVTRSRWRSGDFQVDGIIDAPNREQAINLYAYTQIVHAITRATRSRFTRFRAWHLFRRHPRGENNKVSKCRKRQNLVRIRVRRRGRKRYWNTFNGRTVRSERECDVLRRCVVTILTSRWVASSLRRLSAYSSARHSHRESQR